MKLNNNVKWILLIVGMIGFFLVALTNNPIAIFGYFGLYLCSMIAIFQYFFKNIEAPHSINVLSMYTKNQEKQIE